MVHGWLCQAKGLVAIPLLLVLVLAVACGAATTPTSPPAQTLAPPAATTTAAPGATAVPVATPKPSPTPTIAAAVGKYGGVIPMHDYAFAGAQFHPHYSRNQQKNFGPIYNTLVEFNPETDDRDDLRGDLAESWQLSQDGRVYTFHLHKNARWQDGTPVTAADVVFSVDSMVNPNPPRPISVPVMYVYYTLGTATAIDDHTVQVPLTVPAADFLPTLALDRLKILPKQWVESHDIDKWENQMGSGPFTPGKLIKDVSIELEKNPNYWKPGRPFIDGMKHITIVDKGTSIAAYKTEQVLMTTFAVTQLSAQEAVRLQEEEKAKLTVHFMPNNSWISVMINATAKPFDDIRVRRALNLALHRQPIVQTVGIEGLEDIGPALGRGTWFGRSLEEIATLPGLRELGGEKHPEDIAEARRLLAEAGFPEGFKVQLMCRTVLEFCDVAQIVAVQLKKFLNIDATIQQVESAIGILRYDKRDYALALQGNANDIIQPDLMVSKSWIPGGVFTEWSGWSPPDFFQELYTKQSRELDAEKRKAILREIEDYLIYKDPGSAVILYHGSRHIIVNNRVKNYHPASVFLVQLKNEHIWLER